LRVVGKPKKYRNAEVRNRIKMYTLKEDLEKARLSSLDMQSN
jgi:hypothetical protein